MTACMFLDSQLSTPSLHHAQPPTVWSIFLGTAEKPKQAAEVGCRSLLHALGVLYVFVIKFLAHSRPLCNGLTGLMVDISADLLRIHPLAAISL